MYESTAMPLCRGCGKLFRETDQVHNFYNRNFHYECFYCYTCKCPLTAYTAEPWLERPYCSKCRHDKQQEASAKDKTPKICSGCGLDFVGQKFLVKEDRGFHFDCFKCVHCDMELMEKMGRQSIFLPHKLTPVGLFCIMCEGKNKDDKPLSSSASPSTASAPAGSASPATTSHSTSTTSASVAGSPAKVGGGKFCENCGVPRGVTKFCTECGTKYPV